MKIFMHVKIFDCDIFIDSHKISINDSRGGSSEKSFNTPLHTFFVKEVIEDYLLPEKAFEKYWCHHQTLPQLME